MKLTTRPALIATATAHASGLLAEIQKLIAPGTTLVVTDVVAGDIDMGIPAVVTAKNSAGTETFEVTEHPSGAELSALVFELDETRKYLSLIQG